uniref:IF rod domain-containing protein n=1 Tax=Monopterus albus TaxID=43700 RepID=A0A3Q3IN33_MONAL|nr:keratin, type I cytoskeletal 19-like [Monopterus albus]
MPVSLSYSSRSVSGSSGGAPFFGNQTRISADGPFQSRAPSVYGGAGGYGTRISQSSSGFSSGLLIPYGDAAVITSEKATMQNLNDRLASYLQKVHSLEEANRKLELQIREFYANKSVASRDFTRYFAIISELQAQIAKRVSENQNIILRIDNAQLAADDFKMKYEAELSMRTMVEGDVSRLRGVRDNLTLSISDLEMQIQGLKEELVYLKKNHEEEMRQLRSQQTNTVNVEVDSKESADLIKILEEMRERYEAVVLSNKQEAEKWFKLKLEGLQTQIVSHTTEVKTHHMQLSELKRTYQSLEISLQSVLKEIQCLQQNLEEVNDRYNSQLSQQQMIINTLEIELQQLRASIQQQQAEYSLLLDIKMRLELEIAEYRRLLEGEYGQKKQWLISKVTQEKTVEEHKPHVERRVKTIVGEVVNGEVVATSVDTKVQDIQ